MKVLYNGQCPICNLEINHYKKYTDDKKIKIEYNDLNNDELLSSWLVDKKTAAKKLHVLKDCAIYTGLDAFLELWKIMPKYYFLYKFFSKKSIYTIANPTYNMLIAPSIYRWYLINNYIKKKRVQK